MHGDERHMQTAPQEVGEPTNGGAVLPVWEQILALGPRGCESALSGVILGCPQGPQMVALGTPTLYTLRTAPATPQLHPLAQAQPQSQKSGQQSGSTPTPCLHKPMFVCDTCDSEARTYPKPYKKEVQCTHKIPHILPVCVCCQAQQVPRNRSPSNGCSCPHDQRDQK